MSPTTATVLSSRAIRHHSLASVKGVFVLILATMGIIGVIPSATIPSSTTASTTGRISTTTASGVTSRSTGPTRTSKALLGHPLMSQHVVGHHILQLRAIHALREGTLQLLTPSNNSTSTRMIPQIIQLQLLNCQRLAVAFAAAFLTPFTFLIMFDPVCSQIMPIRSAVSTKVADVRLQP